MSGQRDSIGGQPMEKYFFRASAEDFKKIPGSPIVYWASEKVLGLFHGNTCLAEKIETREGLTTGSNERFLRVWYEVSEASVGFDIKSNCDLNRSDKRYFKYIKGGDFRRWSGNYEYVVNWFNDGQELRQFIDKETGRVRSHNYNGSYAFKTGLTWSGISSGSFSVRHVPAGFMFDAKGPMGFAKKWCHQATQESFLNSTVASHLIKMLAPTLDFKLGHVLNLPLIDNIDDTIRQVNKLAVKLSTCDWNSYETSWDFTSLPLLHTDYHQPTLEATYKKLRTHWCEMTQEMQRLEEENNRIFIDAYGLADELTPDVPFEEITLTCNPHYRYGGNKTDDELEAMLLADTMREFCSYAVGCMFGRYSLDKPGLVLANQGETLADYLAQVPESSFTVDDDNVIPLLDGDWFTDDITLRFREFLKVTFGEARYEDNLAFIEQALNIKGKRNYSLRDYFVKEFYADHVKRYKKRPIYWLFSSPKGSFNALVYLHRYRPDTVSVVLTYLRDFRDKLETEQRRQTAISDNSDASQGDRTRAGKEVERLRKILTELEDYEREVLYPLATERLEIDLDDGVKVNYPKFGKALKKVAGLSA